jgi:predicted ferric reductase
VLVAAGVTWWIDAVLLHRVANGTDHATRLAAILTYVGVDGWYTLARAMGITALVFAYASVLLGLVAAQRPRGTAPVLGAVHRQVGAVTVPLVAGHAVLPFASVYKPYGGVRTSFVPFAQPVSWGIRAASWESFGILAFYLLLLTGPTYYIARRRERAWVLVHRLALVVYALSVAHAFLLGTDFLVTGPARVALLAAQVPLLLLLARRLAPSARMALPVWHWVGAVLAVAGSAALATLAVLVATGRYAPGLRL